MTSHVKRIKSLRDTITEAGLEILQAGRPGKHIKFRVRSADNSVHVLIAAVTESDHRSAMNFRSLCRRLGRQGKNN